jgi:hypothetical protein
VLGLNIADPRPSACRRRRRATSFDDPKTMWQGVASIVADPALRGPNVRDADVQPVASSEVELSTVAPTTTAELLAADAWLQAATAMSSIPPRTQQIHRDRFVDVTCQLSARFEANMIRTNGTQGVGPAALVAPGGPDR